MSEKNLYIIDGTALIYRSFFAFMNRPLINKNGLNTSGLFGFINTIEKLKRDFKAEYIVFAFDKSKKTFRHQIYKEYKATRDKMPDDLRQSLPYFHKICDALNFKYFEMDEYEADDILATVAKDAVINGFDNAFIVTRDKDLMQLVTENIKLIDLHQDGLIIDREEVYKKFEVYPENIIDLLSMMGDKSDNIPGIKGVGQKGAVKLLHEYNTLEEVYENLDNIKAKKLNENLRTYKEDAFFSKKLVTIVQNIEMDIQNWEKFKISEPNREPWLELLTELEFTGILKKYIEKRGDELGSFDDSSIDDSSLFSTVKMLEKKSYKLANESELKEIFEKSKKNGFLVLDLETTSLDFLKAEVVGISFASKSIEAVYVNINHQEDTNRVNLEFIIESLNNLLENTTIVGHNIKYDLKILRRFGLKTPKKIFDTMIAAWVLNPTSNRYGLDILCVENFGYSMQPITDLIGKKKSEQITFDKVSIVDATFYGAEDSDYTFKLYEKYKNEIGLSEESSYIFYNIEMELIKVIIEIEENGILLDIKYIHKLGEIFNAKINSLKTLIFEIAGEEFNLNSPKKLGEILFEKLEIPVVKKTKGGSYSTDESVLSELSKTYDITKLIIDYRKLTKLVGTYIDGLTPLVDDENRIHASFNQTGTSTGRLSSSNPNLQNIPIKSEEGREIRKSFIAKEGIEILSFDYSQIELRVMAIMSRDETLKDIFINGEDVHNQTAITITGKSVEELNRDDRRVAKVINFGILYGMKPFGVSNAAEISVADATNFIKKYFESFSGVKKYINELLNRVEQNGYSITKFGRKRPIKEIYSSNRNIKEHGKRTAISSVIQGTAADIIKLAMIKVYQFMKKENLQSKLILQIHDELLFEVTSKEKELIINKIKDIMESVIGDEIPLTTEYGFGNNWLDAH